METTSNGRNDWDLRRGMIITVVLHTKYSKRKKQDATFSVYYIADKTRRIYFKLETGITLKWYDYGKS